MPNPSSLAVRTKKSQPESKSPPRTPRALPPLRTAPPARGKAAATKPPKRQAGRKRAAAKKAPRLSARTADKHVLYQLAVQAPEREVAFLSRYFKRTTGAPLRVLREDFCGTAVMSCWFVKLHRDNRAIGVDLHAPTLRWGVEHNVEPLLDDDQRQRLQLIHDDVCNVTKPRAQAIAALNFSFSVFQTRAQLKTYLETCFRSLEPGGMLFLDDWGGPDVIKEDNWDRTRHKGFTYVWEQRSWDPINHHIVCAIHFEFPDGTKLKEAFLYDWRLWTLPELRELMTEVGFEDVHVLWEGSDRDGEGNGVFKRRARGEADEAWIVYVVGRKPGGNQPDGRAAAPRAAGKGRKAR